MPDLLPITVVFIVVGLPIICGTIVTIAKIIRGDGRSGPASHPRRGATDDDAQLMQEIHSGLGRLESRLEALETIVLESERKKKAATHD